MLDHVTYTTPYCCLFRIGLVLNM